MSAGTHHPHQPVNAEEQDAQGHAQENSSFNDVAVPVGVHEGRCWAEVQVDAHSLTLFDRMRQLRACNACAQAQSLRQRALPQHKLLKLLLRMILTATITVNVQEISVICRDIADCRSPSQTAKMAANIVERTNQHQRTTALDQLHLKPRMYAFGMMYMTS